MKNFIGKTLGAVILSVSLLFGTALCAFASDATIKDDGTRIRSDSSTGSNVVTTASKGSSYSVLDTVTGEDGNTWYKIQVNDSTIGYVRGDLVDVSGDTAAAPAAEGEASEVTSSAPGTPINPATATVKEPSVNIRSGAGTDYSKVGALTSGTAITLSAEAKDANGATWYQMSGGGLDGYIRSDFIALDEGQEITYPGDTENTEENTETEEAPEETYVEPEPVVNNDYEVVYTTDADGVYQYYLYDHINNTKQKVPELLSAVEVLNSNYLSAKSQLTTFKIMTIVFGALALLAIGLSVFLFIRLRNGYEEEYYEDDFEEEEKTPAVRKRPAEDNMGDVREARRPRETGDRPVRTERGERPVREREPQREPQRAPERRAVRDDRGEERPAQPRRAKRPQNFLADDDEFEFEFLNMDD